MEQINENVFRMWETLSSYLSENDEAWPNFIPFREGVDTFREIIEEANAAVKEQEHQDPTSKTLAKSDLQDQMIALALLVADNAHAFAQKEKNVELANDTDMTTTYFVEKKGHARLQAVKNLVDVVRPFVAQLISYEITDATLDELSALADSYGNSLGKPGATIAQRKTATHDASAIKRKGQHFLRTTLDKLVRHFEEKNPTFVSGYRNARIVRDLSGKGKKPPETPTH